VHVDEHLLTGGLVTAAAAWLMIQSGYAKGMIELKRPRRRCPSCGRSIRRRVCDNCVN